MKIVIILGTVLILCGCAGRSGRGTGVSDSLAAAAPVRIPTVEDTVLNQIGGKLWGLNVGPGDSITVIGRNYWPEQTIDGGLGREYRFIIHDKYSKEHGFFEPDSLKAYFEEYGKEAWYVSWYRESALPELDTVIETSIDPGITDYTGFWVVLSEYDGDYYLDTNWEWIAAFYIADTLYWDMTVEGPEPSRITRFEKKDGGGYILQTLGEKGKNFDCELIDSRRKVYRDKRGMCLTPASAVHSFEIIDYTNNTGCMIDWGY